MALSNQSVVIDILGNVAGFVSDMDRATRAAKKSADDMERQFRNVGRVIGGALVAGVTALVAGTVSAVNEMDKLGDRVKKVGIGAEVLSSLGHAAKLSGVEISQMDTAIVRLSKNIVDAAGGGGAAKAFEAIGVAVTDANGKIRSTEQILVDVANKFKGYEEGAGKVALATQLFGRAGAEILPMLAEMETSVQGVTDEASRFGATVSGEAVAAAQQLNDNIDLLKTQFGAFFRGIAEQVLPALVSLSATFIDVGAKSGAASSGVSMFAEALKLLLKLAVVISAQFQVLGKTLANVFGNLNGLTLMAEGFKRGNLEIIAAGRKMIDFKIIVDDVGDVIATAVKRIDALSNPTTGAFANVTAGAKSTAESVGKVAAPVIAMGNAATVAAPKIQKMERTLDEVVVTASRAELALIDAWDAVEQFQDVNRVAEQMMRVQMALEEVSDPQLRRELEEVLAVLSDIVPVLGEEIPSAAEEAARASAEAAARMKDEWTRSVNAMKGVFAGFLSGAIRGSSELGRAMAQVGRQNTANFTNNLMNGQSPSQQPGMFGPNGQGSSVGGWMNAAGSGMASIEAAEQGNFWGAVGNGAAAGNAIYPGWGAVVGAIVGAIAYVVLKPDPPQIHIIGPELAGKPPYANLAPNSTFQSQLGGFTLASIDEVPAADRAQFGAALVNFDNSLAQIIGPGNNLDKVIDALRGFNLQLHEGAITAENIIAGRFDAVLGVFSEDVQQFVNEVTKIEDRVQRLGDALAIQAAIDAGAGLGLNFAETLRLVSELNRTGETAGATFTRLAGVVRIMDDLIEIFGATFDGSREDLIAFGDQLAETFGGLERFANVASQALAALFSPAEIAQMVYNQARTTATRELADIGLGPDATAAEIRAVIEHAIATGNDVLLKEALEAGAAFGRLGRALETLNQTTAGVTNGIIILAATNDLVRPGTGFERGVDFIEDGPIPGSASAIEEFAVATRSAGEAALEAAEHLRDLADEYRNAQNGIQEWLDAQRFMDTSTLTPAERLAEAARQFDVTLLAAQAGDLDALRDITGIAQTYLGEGRGFYSSSDNYTSIEARVRGALEGLVGQDFTKKPTPGEQAIIDTIERESGIDRLRYDDMVALLTDVADEGGDGNALLRRLIDARAGRVTP